MFLFDTVALSEATKQRENPGFVERRKGIDPAQVFTSVIYLGEIMRGAYMLKLPDRAPLVLGWLTELRSALEQRVLLVDAQVAARCGQLGARGKVEPVDALIGCTALCHGLSVVTRNSRHFDGLGVQVINPWT